MGSGNGGQWEVERWASGNSRHVPSVGHTTMGRLPVSTQTAPLGFGRGSVVQFYVHIWHTLTLGRYAAIQYVCCAAVLHSHTLREFKLRVRILAYADFGRSFCHTLHF
jgi:hypothetical protein